MALTGRCLWALLASIAAAASADDPISPDRPNFSNSCTTTPRGRFVLELGYRQTQASETMHDYGDGATLRFGVDDRLEIRVGLPSIVVQGGKGFGDAGLGLKWRFADAKGASRPALALLLSTTLPCGESDFGERTLQPEARLLASFGVSGTDEVDANLVAGLPVESGDRYTRYGASASLTHSFDKLTGGFVEFYTQLPGSFRGPDQTYADLGVTRLLCDDCQVDAFFGRGLNGDWPDRFFGGGIAYRF